MKRAVCLALAVFAFAGPCQQPATAKERIHFIAAEEVTWNYAPQGRDVISGSPLRRQGVAQLGWIYRKAVYREYTDSTFTKLLSMPPEDRYRGLVGPSLHAEVGDTLVIVFRNRTAIPVDIAPSGVRSIPSPTALTPGTTRTYRWPVTASAGPGPADASSVEFAYQSNIRPREDATGLIGPLIITRRGSARADGSPADVDREIVALFSSQLENRNPLLDENLNDRSINGRGIRRDAKTFADDNVFPSINGFVYGNMPVPTMHVHDHVRWYLLSTANGFDGHVPTWTGQTVLFQGNRSDSIDLVFRNAIADMVPDNPGVWLLTCSVDIHLALGMEARYDVLP